MEEDIENIEEFIEDLKPNLILKQSLENLIKRCIALDENLKIATAMLTKGQYPEKNKGDNDFGKQFIPRAKIQEIKEKNEKKIDEMRPYKHQGPFDFGVLNGIDECCRILLEDK